AASPSGRSSSERARELLDRARGPSLARGHGRGPGAHAARRRRLGLSRGLLRRARRDRRPDPLLAPARGRAMKAVALEGLEKTYSDGTRAVRGVDLAIEAGEFVVLLGPSGCGKTTTLRMIAGLETPSAGRIR